MLVKTSCSFVRAQVSMDFDLVAAMMSLSIEYDGYTIVQPSLSKNKEALLSQKKPGFLSMPPELRDEVYRHLLIVDRWQVQNNPHEWRLTPSILRVNKLVHQEASAVLYFQNC